MNLPFPLTSISPRSLTLYEGDSNSRVDSDMCICMAWLVASIRAAVLTESPKRQYRGIFKPTMPATTAPLWMPTRIWRWLPVKINTCFKNKSTIFSSFLYLLNDPWDRLSPRPYQEPYRIRDPHDRFPLPAHQRLPCKHHRWFRPWIRGTQRYYYLFYKSNFWM